MSDFTLLTAILCVAGIALGLWLLRSIDKDLKVDKPVIVHEIGEFLDAIWAANPDRHHKTMDRRLLKLGEELGETSEAYLNVTSAMNAKNKTWDDVREEAIDTAIVAIDIALTPLPTEDKSVDEIKQEVMRVLDRKLSKWADNRSTQSAATQTSDDAI